VDVLEPPPEGLEPKARFTASSKMALILWTFLFSLKRRSRFAVLLQYI